jgi:hypothetical protein
MLLNIPGLLTFVYPLLLNNPFSWVFLRVAIEGWHATCLIIR